MSVNTYLETPEAGVQRYRIQSKSGIYSPSYIPEIKGDEGLRALLNESQALDEKNPIFAPGYIWKNIRYGRLVNERQKEIDRLQEKFPFLLYEPVELFRYKRPHSLVSYAFKAKDATRSNFNTAIRNGDISAALGRLDDFISEFVRANLVSLAEKVVGTENDPPGIVEEYEWGGTTIDVWNKVIDTPAMENYFGKIVSTAMEIPDTYVIPPVPPMTESVDERDINNLISTNNMMLAVCEEANESIYWGFEASEDKLTHPYFHLYIDKAFIENTYRSNSAFTRRLQGEISSGHYAGMALTLTNVHKATDALNSFVNDMTNIAEQFGIPVICPRLPWKGIYLSDLGVNGFGGLLRSMQEYAPKAAYGSGGIPKPNQYSSLPDISSGKNLGIKEVYSKLREEDSLNDTRGLPTFENQFMDLGPDIEDDQLDQVFDSPEDWRVGIQKPHWLEMADLAKKIQEDKQAGEKEPGKKLLEDIDHDFVSN